RHLATATLWRPGGWRGDFRYPMPVRPLPDHQNRAFRNASQTYTRPEDDIVALGNLAVLGERIGFVLGPERRPDIEDILGPLYESARQRVESGTEFRARLTVDLSMAACGAALRKHATRQREGDPSLADLLDEAFEVLAHGVDC
ncbi:hypothetical protein ACQR3Q_09215, partial [Dietzia natronolimnaea]